MCAIDITAEQRKTVLALLARHLPNTTAWVYGSRVKWTARPQSDLDLVVFAKPEQERRVSDLREAFEESNLPFRVDLFVWDEVPEQFRKTIEAEHVVLVEREEPGVVGEGWVLLRLGDVCTKIGSGATPRGGKEVYLKDGPFALIRSQNVYNNRFNCDGLAFINHQQATELNNVEVFADDVLLNITGDSVARACQVKSDVLPARVNQHVAIIRPDPNKLSPRFLRYFLVCPEIQAMLLSWAGSGGTRNALTKGMIESFDVQAPMDVAEQRAIAHILGTLDDKIELNRRMNQTLEEMARALFKSWFIDFDPVRAKATLKHHASPPQGRSDWSVERARAYLDRMDPNIAALFPDSFVDSELSPIPEGWEISTIGDEVAVVGGSTPSTKDGSLWGGAISWATPKDLSTLSAPVLLETARQISDTGLSKISSGLLPRGAVLLSSRAPIGYLAITEIPVAVNQGFIAMRCESRLSNVFVWLWTQANIDTILQYANGSTFQEISKRNFRPLGVAIPETDILSAFDKHARPLYKQIVKNQRESRTLAALRDGLLPKLVSGELRLPHVNRIPTRSA